jgi:hypothetical protein
MNLETINQHIINKPSSTCLDSFVGLKGMAPFTEAVIDYLNDLSKTLLGDPRTREYPDVITFAFYCRKGNLLGLKEKNLVLEEVRLGRGLIFHIAPSNVPVNFAYSLIAGLLSGNANVVRVPSKDFEQIRIIVDAIDALSNMDSHSDVSGRIILIRYSSEKEDITKKLSSICAVRVIWGGDQTIRKIRKHDLPPRSIELTFADRYSLCVIQAESILNTEFLDRMVSGFYNDTYLFDQNACTSPHLVVWLGSNEDVATAQDMFWGKLHALVRSKFNLQTVQSVNKISSFYSQAIEMPNVNLVRKEDNFLWRVKLNTLGHGIENYRCNSGYFSEYHAKSLNEISSIVTSKYQTLAYFGVPKIELIDFITSERLEGIDRLVPIGRTTDFSMTWDGFDLIKTLSRVVQVL